jgi:integrase
VRAYRRVGERFLGALAAIGAGLRAATVEDVQAALEAMRIKQDGSPVRPATVNTYVAAVKSFLGFANRLGFTRFNAAPLIKGKKAPRRVAQRILGELEVRDLIKHAKPGRDRLMLQVAYFGGLRVSELVSLAWSQVIRRDSGEAQLSIVGKGDKAREVLIPAAIATPLLASRGDAPASAPVFGSVRRRGQPLTERAVNYIEGRRRARRGQPGGVGALVAPCARLPRYRQRRAGHARTGNARSLRPEDHQRLRARAAGREFWALSQDEVKVGDPSGSAMPSRFPPAACTLLSPRPRAPAVSTSARAEEPECRRRSPW